MTQEFELHGSLSLQYPWPCLQKPSSSSHSLPSTKSSLITATDTSTRKRGELTYADLLDRITASCEHTSLPYQNQRKLLDVLITLINGQVGRALFIQLLSRR